MCGFKVIKKRKAEEEGWVRRGFVIDTCFMDRGGKMVKGGGVEIRQRGKEWYAQLLVIAHARIS